MKEVTIKKSELIAILTKNRSEHRDIFIEARAKFRAAAITALDAMMDLAKQDKPFKLNSLALMTQPADYTREYDRAIKMLELSVHENITISEEEFRHFVMDQWNWSHNWALSNSGYSTSPKLRVALNQDDD